MDGMWTHTLPPSINWHSLWDGTWTRNVTFEGNILLDLSGGAATKTLCSLMTEPLLQVLSQSTRTMAVWVIRGDEGMGDFPGIRGVQGSL